MKCYTKELFVSALSEVDWSCIYLLNDVNAAWNKFECMLLSIIDKVAPKKQRKIKVRSEPWINHEILENIRLRDKYLKLFHNSKDPSIYTKFCSIRNRIQHQIKVARKNYFKTEIEKNKNNTKKLWNNLKQLGYQTKSKANSAITLKIDGTPCHDSRKTISSSMLVIT